MSCAKCRGKIKFQPMQTTVTLAVLFLSPGAQMFLQDYQEILSGHPGHTRTLSRWTVETVVAGAVARA